MEVEKRLKEALDEQLTKDMEKIPTEEEIKVRHTFTDSFLTYMQQVIYNENRNKKKRRVMTRNYFLRAAACLVCLVGIGTLMFTAFPFGKLNSTNKGDRMEATSESTQATESTQERSGDADTGTNSIESDQMPMGIESQSKMEDADTTEYFILKSQSFDGDYHVEVSVNNQTDNEMTYTPIYEWSYTLNGKTTTTSMDMDIEGSKKVLKSGDAITETYDLKDYGIKKGGGVLEITRMINEEETTLSITIEP